MSLAVSEPVVGRFIAQARIVRLATLSPAGNPDIIPIWFIEHRGRIYMGTRRANPVVRDLLVNPRVVLIFHRERGKRRDRVLRIRGTASFATQGAPRWLYLRMGLRYYLAPGGLWSMVRHLRLLPVMMRYYRERGDEGGFIEVVPETAEVVVAPSLAAHERGG
jgi:hypothetical protein